MILRRPVLNLAATVVLVCAVSRTGAAQGTATPVAPPSNVVKQSRPYYVEGAVVILLMAAAGFAVCRSSRRV